MAKKSKQTNGIDAAIAADHIKRVESLHADLLSERGEYMAACRSIREDIKQVFTDAKEQHGIPTKTLKAIVKQREYQRKVDSCGDFLDIDERASFEQLVEDLGGLVDLPLGAAAIEAQKRKDAKEFDLPGGGKKKGKTSPEEAAALAEVEDKGVVGAIGDAAATFTETAATH